ncbi:MAG: Rap1a/Tai family immunity protein [Sphingobium sp.]
MNLRAIILSRRQNHFCTYAALLLWATGPGIADAAAAPDYANVSSLTTAQLSQICDQDGESGANARGISLSACNAYILGAADHMAIERVFCLDSNFYASRVVMQVRRYFRAHPARGTAPPVTVIRDALAEGFPCEKK